MIDLLIDLTDFYGFHLIHLLFQSLIAGILLYLIHHLPDSEIYFPENAFNQCCSNSDKDEVHKNKEQGDSCI